MAVEHEEEFGMRADAFSARGGVAGDVCAAEFLTTHNLDELPLGKTKIDGDNVFVNVMEFEPALPGDVLEI